MLDMAWNGQATEKPPVPSSGYTGIRWLDRVPKPKKFDQKKGVRRLARERVGTVPAPRVIDPKTRRKKPKHPKPPGVEELDAG